MEIVPVLRRSYLFAFLLGAASPLFINVALIEVVRVIGFPVASAVLHSGLFTDHPSFISATRTLNGFLLGGLIAVVFGVPLALVAKRRVLTPWLVFVVGVLVASAILHLTQQWGISGFIDQWRYPEMWLSLLGVGVVAALVSRTRRRRETQHVASGDTVH